MTKIILSALVVIVILIASYFLVFSSRNQSSNTAPVTQEKSQITKLEPTPTISEVVSDDVLAEDITALDKELAEIEKGDSDFTKELQGL